MAKVKLTKGELKRQRDALRQYERYLPTLQLKKQQLQIEIFHQVSILEQKENKERTKRDAIQVWSGLLSDPEINLAPGRRDVVNIHSWVIPKETVTGSKSIAGVDLPVFDHVEFSPAEYDLFTTPLWVDTAIEALRDLVCIREEMEVVRAGTRILRHELRITTQRVNLFEKVKIPEAQEAIRLIKIYIGDQMANAVGRSKIAKRKIEEAVMEEVAA